MLRPKYALLGMILIGIVGCNKPNKENAAQQPAPVQQPAAAPAPPQSPPESVKESTPPEPAKAEAPPKQISRPAKKAQIARKEKSQEAPAEPLKPQPAPEPQAAVAAPVAADQKVEEAPEPPKARQPQFAVIPNGTRIRVRLQSPLDSAINISGDTFRAILDENISIGGTVVAPRGSILEGKLSHVERSGRVQGRANMALQLTNLLIDDAAYPIQTEILTFEAESSAKKDASKVGIGAGIGAVIGAIAGGGKGAAIGAAVGAGAGGATVMATRGNEVKLEAERQLTFATQRDISVKLP